MSIQPNNRPSLDENGYAQFEEFDSFSYLCIKYLMDNNELIWKLLKYTTPDAWEQADLTTEEKRGLIFDGSEDGSLFQIFLDDGLPDVQTREDAILRITPFSIFPRGRTIADVMIRFEVYSHWKINHLSNYKTRVAMMVKQILQTFNGTAVGGIGRLHFNQGASSNARGETSGQIPFKGKVLYFGNKSN